MMKLAIFTAGLFLIQLCLAENSYLVVLPKLFKVNYDNEFMVVCVKPVEISFELVLGQQRIQRKLSCLEGETRNVTFPIPKAFPIGVGELTIQGRGGIEFMEKREVIVYDDRYILLIQTSSSSYRPNDTVEFRVVATDENLIPIESAEVTIEIFDSTMKLITDFKKVPVRNGLCDTIRYTLPVENLKYGSWLISATIENTTSSVQIFVSRPQSSSFDLKVLFPRFLLRSDKSLRGSIELSDDCDRPIFGRAQITIGQVTEQDLRSGEKTERAVGDGLTGLKTKSVEIGGRIQLNCDLATTYDIDMSKALALKIFIDVVDNRTMEHRFVQHIIPVFNREVVYDILPMDFEAGQKNEYEIMAKRPDGKPVKMEDVIVNVTMMFESEEPRSIEIKDLYTRGRNDVGLFNFDCPKNCIGVLLTLTPVGEDGKLSGYRTQTLPLMPTPKQRDITGAKLTIELMPEREIIPSIAKTQEPTITTMLATVGKEARFYVQLLPKKTMDRPDLPLSMNYVLLTNGRITATGVFTIEPTKYCQETKIAPRTIRPETQDPSIPPQCVYNGTLELMMTREMVPYSTLLIYAFNSTWGFNVAENYRFSVYGLFQNNLTLGMAERKVENMPERDSAIFRDAKISPKARNFNLMDLTCTGLPESIVGVNVISYDAITEGLPNDITKERLLRYLTAYEFVPVQAMPVSSMPEEHIVSPRTSSDVPVMTPEQIKKQHEGYKIRYLLEKIAFGLRSGHRLRPVDGDDAYLPTNMDHFYSEKKPQQNRLKDVFQSKSNNRNRQYNVIVDKNDYTVLAGMPPRPPPHGMKPIVGEHEHEHEHEEEHRDDSSSEQEVEPQQQHFQYEYGTPQWYKRMNSKMSLLSREAFMFMQSGLAVVSDFSSLQIPKELHHLNLTSTIRSFRQQSSMLKDQDSYSFRQNARTLLMKYMSEVDASFPVPPPSMYDEQSRSSYYRSLMFNSTKLDSQGLGKFVLPRTNFPFTTWMATGFSLNSKSGLGIAQPIRLSTPQGLYCMASTKKIVQINERVPFSWVVSNYLMKDIQNVLVRIRSSPDFDLIDSSEKFIKMDKEFTMTIPTMKSEESITRSMFIVPKRMGVITIIMEVESEFGGDYEIVTMTCGDKIAKPMDKLESCQSSEWKWW